MGLFFSDQTQLDRIEGKINVIGAQMTSLIAQMAVLTKRFFAAPIEVDIDLDHARIYDKQGNLIMSGSANVTTDHDLKVPLLWKDDVGTVSAPTSGTTAVSDTPAVATVDVGADDLEIFVRSVAVGSAKITVTNGSLTDTIQVNVTAPAATSLAVDAADAVLVPKGTTA